MPQAPSTTRQRLALFLLLCGFAQVMAAEMLGPMPERYRDYARANASISDSKIDPSSSMNGSSPTGSVVVVVVDGGSGRI